MGESNRDVALALVKQFRYGNNLMMVDRIAAALDAAYARGRNEAVADAANLLQSFGGKGPAAARVIAKHEGMLVGRAVVLIDKIAEGHDRAMIKSGTACSDCAAPPSLGPWTADDAGWKRCAPDGEVGAAASPLPDGRWKWFVWERGGPRVADDIVASERQAKAAADASVPVAGWARLADAVRVDHG